MGLVSKQEFLVDMVGYTQRDITIAAVDLARSWPEYTMQLNVTSQPDNASFIVELINSTTLRVRRDSIGSNDTVALLRVQVLEGGSRIRTHKVAFTNLVVGTPQTAAVPGYNKDKSFVVPCGNKDTTVSNKRSREDLVRYRLIDGNTLEASNNSGGPAETLQECVAYVVEHLDCSVQHIDFSPGGTSHDVAITTVDPNKTRCVLTGSYDVDQILNQDMWRGWLQTATNFHMDRNTGGVGVDATLQVIEFSDSTVVDRGEFTSGDATGSVTVPDRPLTRRTLHMVCVSDQGGYCGHSYAQERMRLQVIELDWASTTAFDWTRTDNAGTIYASWEAIAWASGSPAGDDASSFFNFAGPA